MVCYDFMWSYSALAQAFYSGDLVYIEALGQPIIVIGSYEVANELLGKRGVIYSDRPPLPFADVKSVLCSCITLCSLF